MRSKQRVTVTIDSELIEAANKAVSEGRVASLSGWVNLALSERVTKERRLRALAEAIDAYEETFREIDATELITQERVDRQDAISVRARRRSKSR